MKWLKQSDRLKMGLHTTDAPNPLSSLKPFEEIFTLYLSGMYPSPEGERVTHLQLLCEWRLSFFPGNDFSHFQGHSMTLVVKAL
jgi:hypothetical protein